MKEFGWIPSLQAKLNCNCPKFPSDLKLTSSVDKLMYGNCLSQSHFLSCWISSSVLTENSVYQVLDVKNWDRDWNTHLWLFFWNLNKCSKKSWTIYSQALRITSTWLDVKFPRKSYSRVTEKNTIIHSTLFFFKLCPMLGVNVCLEILLKTREIEYLYRSKEKN